MTPREIKKLLIDKDLSQSDLARRLNVTPSAVSQVVNGLRPNPRVAEGLARILNLPVSSLRIEPENSSVSST